MGYSDSAGRGWEAFADELSNISSQTWKGINHTAFYMTANPTYITYYTMVLKRNAEWLDGYVSGFHDYAGNPVISTRLAASLAKGIGNQIVGTKIRFKGSGTGNDTEAIKKLNEWSDAAGFQGAVRQGIRLAVGLGTSLLKLNASGDGSTWCEALRLDSFWFLTDMRKNLTEVTCLIKRYANAMPNGRQADPKEGTKNYYLVEHRFYKAEPVRGIAGRDWFYVRDSDGNLAVNKDGSLRKVYAHFKRVPYVEYGVRQYNGNVTNDIAGYSADLQRSYSWGELPQWLRRSLAQDYGAIRIGEPSPLPFIDLGCQLLRNDEDDISAPALPFGSSILQDIQAYLMDYDLEMTYKIRDEYIGKGTILVPQSMSADMAEGIGGGNPASALDSIAIQKIPSVDPMASTPTNVQFELRQDQWQFAMDNTLKKIATTLGMSPKTIASYLTDAASAKTATEIDSEDDATLAYIEIKRSIFKKPIDDFLKSAMANMAITADIEVAFGTPSMINRDRVIDREVSLLNAGLTTPEDSIHEIWPDEDEDEIQKRIERAKAHAFEMGPQSQAMASGDEGNAPSLDALLGLNAPKAPQALKEAVPAPSPLPKEN